MKKTLYSTTALAAAGLLTFGASDAFAQAAAPKAPEKLKMAIGGFFTAYAGYAQQSSSHEAAVASGANKPEYTGFDVKNDSEVNLKGSVALDNGMKVYLQIEFETDTARQNGTTEGHMDESYLGLDTNGYGDIRIGTQKHAHLTLNVGAPNAGALNPSNGDTSLWVVRPSSGMSIAAPFGSPSGSDQNRIVYLSPTIAGFRAGLDYTPSTTDSDALPVHTGNSAQTRSYSGIVQYSTPIAGMPFRTALSYVHQNGLAQNQFNAINYGADLKIGDFTVGAGARRQWSPSDAGTSTSGSAAVNANNNNSVEMDSFNFGVTYAPGPYKIGFRTTQTYHEGNRTLPGKDKAILYKVAGNYTIGPGVDLTADVFHMTWDDEVGNNANENRGWAVVGGIAVTF